MPGLQTLETDIDAFRTVISYRRYCRNNRAANIDRTNRAANFDRNADLLLQILKRNVELLYQTLEPFFSKDHMELLGFLLTITEAFNGPRLSGGLETRALGFFFIGFTQMAYTNAVHPGTHDSTRLPVTWPLIVHSMLSRFYHG